MKLKLPNLEKSPDLITSGKWLSAMVVVVGLWFAAQNWNDFFVTPDQRAQKLFDDEQYVEASEQFEDPFHKGIALYKNGSFKEAGNVFGGLPGADAAFNHANSLFMQGQYEAAIKRYDRALVLREDWPAAKTNREIAVARAKALNFDAANMTGGQLGADEIVFDLDPDKANSDESEDEVVEGKGMSDEEMRSVWLRQIQTTPRDFLKAKFAYQLAVEALPPQNEESKAAERGASNE